MEVFKFNVTNTRSSKSLGINVLGIHQIKGFGLTQAVID
jgi:hypothetical protein